ncbi:hypothetical protein L2E82_17277 [Cichorium intybus]|uniref:Uncharacterized protein n=1 Tax=Cichorium intybus TaxID=13427 RepID=A0ACB9F7G7_CICIN|nr:hypothetical protein L2E82_17277 [Cichorium intybus]
MSGWIKEVLVDCWTCDCWRKNGSAATYAILRGELVHFVGVERIRTSDCGFNWESCRKNWYLDLDPKAADLCRCGYMPSDLYNLKSTYWTQVDLNYCIEEMHNQHLLSAFFSFFIFRHGGSYLCLCFS